MYSITSCLAAFIRVIQTAQMVTLAKNLRRTPKASAHVIDVALSWRMSKRSSFNSIRSNRVHSDTKYTTVTHSQSEDEENASMNDENLLSQQN